VKKRLAALPGLLYSGKVNIDQYRSILASTKGWLRWANTHNLSIALDIERLEGILQ